jgi:anti-sigma regulatory factor (Ser/Thr protein kinase)
MNVHLTLRMPSHPCFLSVVRGAVGELSTISGLSKEESAGVTLAVDEALANIIRHAYKNRYDQKIEFDCVVDDQQMEFTLLDQGESPDPAKICAPPVDELALSGRGTHLIEAIMDEALYTKVSEGNQLKLIRRLHSPKVHTDRE